MINNEKLHVFTTCKHGDNIYSLSIQTTSQCSLSATRIGSSADHDISIFGLTPDDIEQFSKDLIELSNDLRGR